MKRMLSLFLLAVLALSLCACGRRQAETVTVSPAPAAQAPQASPAADPETAPAASDEASASVVYFTSDISPEGLQAVYEALNWQPAGKLAVKVSTGEPPASNYLRAELIGPLVQSLDGTIVECNTAYGGSRSSSAMHRQVAEDHGFTSFADFDLMDEEGEGSGQ